MSCKIQFTYIMVKFVQLEQLVKKCKLVLKTFGAISLLIKLKALLIISIFAHGYYFKTENKGLFKTRHLEKIIRLVLGKL